MSIFEHSAASRKYLLLPCMPTANGRLHLGHISGPYLKLDILARHLRRRGDQVWHIFCSDPYDSFILLRARQTGWPPEEVAAHFHQAMVADLKSLDIECDLVIDPLEPRWEEWYARCTRNAIEQIVSRGATEIRSEKFLYAPAHQRFLVGPWLLGNCPHCGAGAGSYFCESCGFCFRPETMLNPHARLDEGDLEWRSVRCLYLRLSQPDWLLSRMRSMGLAGEYAQLVRQYIDEQGPMIRLTQPVPLGISWDVEGEPAQQAIFSYIGLWTYALMCGEVCGQLAGLPHSAFHPDSDITTIGSFGIDNAIPFFVGALGGAFENGLVKPFDFFLVNHFYTLHGEKFSTSRDHAIWAGDIAATTRTGSDAIRCFIAQTNPQDRVTDFNLGHFMTFLENTLCGRWNAQLGSAWSSVSAHVPGPPPEQLMRQLEDALGQQEKALAPEHFQLAEAQALVQSWLDHSLQTHQPSEAYWWLKSLALLAYPFMPRMAVQIWQALGHTGFPSTECFLEQRSPVPAWGNKPFIPSDWEQLRTCLPKGLRAAEKSAIG